MAPSYQLPNLPNLSRAFELRTNPSCKAVTKASESWLKTVETFDKRALLSPSEREQLPAMKLGLLAAICFPGSDLTQLRLMTDFLSLIVLSSRRAKEVTAASELGWGQALDAASDHDGVQLLVHHNLFNCLKDRLGRLTQKSSPSWKVRFGSSVESFRKAQRSSVTEGLNSMDPEIEHHLSGKRDLSGLFMIFDLYELTQNLTLTMIDDATTATLHNLKVLASDVVSCALDVAVFNQDQAQGNERNLISVLMQQRRLSVQGALNYAGNMIKQYLEAFVTAERSLLDQAPFLPANGSGLIPNWLPFTPLVASATVIQPSKGLDPVTMADLTAYVQLLKDCMVGVLNWVYETELYFGKKREEIRTFGWIFLSPKVQKEPLEDGVPGNNL